MDEQKAKALLAEERRQVERLIAEERQDAGSDRAAADEEQGDFADPAERLTAEEADDAVLSGLRERLDAISRAEQRLRDGTYGRSVLSGLPIPDERLEADPAAELTVEEASRKG